MMDRLKRTLKRIVMMEPWCKWVFAGLLLSIVTSPCAQDRWTITAPDESDLELTVWLEKSSHDLLYSVQRGDDALIAPSHVGVTTAEGIDVGREVVVTREERREIDENYTLPGGKTRHYHHRAREITLDLQTADTPFQAQFQVSANSIAFRLLFRQPVDVVKEFSAFKLVDASVGFGQEYIYVNRTGVKDRQNCESMQERIDYADMVGTPWYMPVLFQLKQDRGWVWMSEAMPAGLEGPSYGAGHVICEPDGAVSIDFDRRHGPDDPIAGIRQTPWRVVLFSETLAPIVESTIIENLAEPSPDTDHSWVEAGRVSWPWLTDPWGNTTFAGFRSYIDLAREAGWEYACLDLGWHQDRYPWVQEAVAYADSLDVNTILWYDHNRLDSRETMETEFAKIRRWGVEGVKIDFVYDAHQDMQSKIVEMLRLAYRHRLVVNFHGITAPVGYRRTWPNQLAREAVKAHEWYRANASPPDRHRFAPSSTHYCILPFNRNVAGPMDVTPVMLDPRARTFITTAFDIALPVVCETGLQHYGSKRDTLRHHPAFPFLKACPAAWDETRLLDGFPGEQVLIARRHGEDWFVGGITVAPRTFEVALDVLDPDTDYQLNLYRDGETRDDLVVEQRTVTSTDRLSIPTQQDGGFVAHLRIAE